MSNFDVAVIGGGPGGYVAAIRAAQLGKTVVCIEKYKNASDKPALGGTCLNVGCIPSKALLESSEHYEKLASLDKHGISVSDVKMDASQMIARKDSIVSQLTGGIEQLFKANKVTWEKGHATIIEKGKIKVTDSGKETVITATDIIIATGSIPVNLSVAPMDETHIVDSTGALSFDSVPKRLGVIGAGVIGLELGSVWHRLGAEVTVIEAMDQFLPMMDQAVAKEAARHFKKQKIDIKLGSKLQSAVVENNEVKVIYADQKGEHEIIFDKLLVACGRKPNTENLVAPEVGVLFDERGFVQVDEHCKTAVSNIYAIGDCVRGPMLAHKASEEGVMVSEIIAGQAGHVNLDLIPAIIYTQPEIASIGKTEQQLKEQGIDYKIGDFPFAANGRAKAMDAEKGFVKILADSQTDEILGGHIIGPMASELIQELVVAMEYKAASEDIARICHGHPGLGEAIHEAALAVDKRAIHKVNKK